MVLRRLVLVGLLLVVLSGAPAVADSQAIPVVTGFNFVGLTVSVSGLTSQTLMQQNAAVVGVYRFDQATKKYVSQLNLGSGDFDGAAFDLVPGVGYILRATTGATVNLTGGAAPSSANTLSLQSGFAVASFPTGGTTSQTLMNANASVVGVYRFDTVGKKYVAHLNLGGGDFDGTSFDLVPGSAYVLRLTASATVVIPGSAKTLSSIALSAPGASVASGGTLQISAQGTFSDASTSDLTSQATWAATPSSLGSISASGLFTASSQNSGTAEITATSGIVRSDTLSVFIRPPATPVSIAITPSTATVVTGATQAFTAEVTFSDGSKQGWSGGTWAVTGNATVGSVTSAGLFTGGSKAGTVTVKYTQGTVSGTASATVLTVSGVALSPVAASVALGLTQAFSAEVTLSDASKIAGTAGTWEVVAGTGAGTITQAGLFTATAVGSTTVRYNQSGVSGGATATVTAAVPTTIAVTPTSASVAVGATQAYTAEVTFSDGTKAAGSGGTWSVVAGTAGDGTIDQNGVFTGTAAGAVTVKFVQGGATGTASATVLAITSVAVSPSAASVVTAGTKQFTATLTLSSSATVSGTAGTWSVIAGTGGGTISASGLFTSTSNGTVTVRYTQGGVSGDATVTIAAAVSFAAQIQPILTSRCVTCHGGSAPSAGRSWTSYNNVANSGLIVPGSASTSFFFRYIKENEPGFSRMPLDGTTLPQADNDLIREWINQGALDN